MATTTKLYVKDEKIYTRKDAIVFGRDLLFIVGKECRMGTHEEIFDYQFHKSKFVSMILLFSHSYDLFKWYKRTNNMHPRWRCTCYRIWPRFKSHKSDYIVLLEWSLLLITSKNETFYGRMRLTS